MHTVYLIDNDEEVSIRKLKILLNHLFQSNLYKEIEIEKEELFEQVKRKQE